MRSTERAKTVEACGHRDDALEATCELAAGHDGPHLYDQHGTCVACRRRHAAWPHRACDECRGGDARWDVGPGAQPDPDVMVGRVLGRAA